MVLQYTDLRDVNFFNLRVLSTLMFRDEHETENEKEQEVDDEERCECQICLVVTCLKV